VLNYLEVSWSNKVKPRTNLNEERQRKEIVRPEYRSGDPINQNDKFLISNRETMLFGSM
jgi:hypothetical protein